MLNKFKLCVYLIQLSYLFFKICFRCATGYRGTPVQPGGRCEPTGGI